MIQILSRANGFLNSGDDTQYQILNSIVEHVVEMIGTVAGDWKVGYRPVLLPHCLLITSFEYDREHWHYRPTSLHAVSSSKKPFHQC